MCEREFRAYDTKQRMMVYNSDLWLPLGLKKLGHKEYPVSIADNGIHYTLDCNSSHYENDWEEDVISIFGIEIMEITDYQDFFVPSKKIYRNDIISFHLNDTDLATLCFIGTVQFSNQLNDWIVMSKDGQFIEMLNNIVQPKVIGNLFENPELLENDVLFTN
jgi:hypothetical protein